MEMVVLFHRVWIYNIDDCCPVPEVSSEARFSYAEMAYADR